MLLLITRNIFIEFNISVENGIASRRCIFGFVTSSPNCKELTKANTEHISRYINRQAIQGTDCKYVFRVTSDLVTR